MIILGTPKDINAFVCVDDGSLAEVLHRANFMPLYKDDGVFYFKKTAKIIKFLKKISKSGGE